MAIQDLLDEPYNADPAQERAYRIYKDNRQLYKQYVRSVVSTTLLLSLV